MEEKRTQALRALQKRAGCFECPKFTRGREGLPKFCGHVLSEVIFDKQGKCEVSVKHEEGNQNHG